MSRNRWGASAHALLTTLPLALPLAFSVSAPARAQDEAVGGLGPQIEEVLVTATRRTASMQSVPISVSAFSAEDMRLRGIETGRDIQMSVPNLMIAAGGLGQVQSAISIRGIPGIGIYLDGIWQGGRGVLQANLLDMERVEVLRGPQGTLFGRNTNGGAIQYVTQLPNDQFSIDSKVTVGSFSRFDFQGSINVPLSDSLFLKLTGARYERDGYLAGVSQFDNGKRYGDRNDDLLRGDLYWTPTDRFSLRFTAFNAQRHGTEGRQVRFSTQPDAPWYDNPILKALNWLMAQPGQQFPAPAFDPHNYESGYPGGVVGAWQTRMRQPDDSLIDNSQDYTLTAKWDVSDNMSLEFLTGFRAEQSHQLSLQDAADFVACCRDNRYFDDELFSEEIHLTGTAFDDKTNFLIGTYYSNAENKLRLYRWWYTSWMLPDANGDGNPELNTALLDQLHAYGASVGDAALAAWRPQTFWFADNHRWTLHEVTEKAIFGEVTWHATDRLDLTLGARVSWRDDIEETYLPGPNDAPALFTAPQINSPTEGTGVGAGDMWAGTLVPPAVPGVNETHLDASYTPKFSATYNWTDTLMTYLTYAEGFSEGSTEYVSAIDKIINLDPETVESYELGMKSDLLDGSLRLNANVFFSDWNGLRVSRHPVDPATGLELPSPYTTSDGKAKVKGAEAEVVWATTDRLRFNFSAGWLDTRYTDIGDPDVSSLAFGAPFAYAPEWSFTQGLQYDLPLSNGGMVTLRQDYGWKSEYQRDPSVARQTVEPEPAYGLLNVRAIYAPAGGQWTFTAFGSNLTNERYVDGGFVSAGLGLDLITVGPPREVGVSLSVSFQ